MSSFSGISTVSSTAFTPASYLVHSIDLTNHAGRVIDIKMVVTDFVVTESIYMTSVTAKFSIQDSVNLFEEMQLIGQETIRIKLFRQDNIINAFLKSIDLTFFVTEYPLYGRADGKQHMQVYTITGISEHAYVSQFKVISRAVTGLTSTLIQKILENDLLVPAKNISIIGDPISQFQGIIPNMKPLNAIEWLRRRTYDKDGSPFYIFQTVTRGIILQSLSSMLKQSTNPLYATYTDSKGYTETPISDKDYAQQASRILEVTSTLKLSKILGGMNGAYASSNHYLDISTKSYKVKFFDYNKHFNSKNTLQGNPILSNTFKIHEYGNNSEKVSLNEMVQASEEFIPLNVIAYSPDGNINNYQGMSRDFLDKANAFQENMETYIHDIHLMGDYTLNAGCRIKLQFPKAEDPSVKKIGAEVQDTERYDSTFTGFYLAVSVVHKFGDDGYYCDVRVKRDSLSFKLS
jgi:hypothetical protein